MTKINLDGHSIHYESLGDGKEMVLIHGFPLDHSIWLGVAELLRSDFRVIMPDLPGFGASDALVEPGSMEAYCHWLHSFLDALGIDQVYLTGHSMGGYVALHFMKLFPERIKGLALVGSQVFADTAENKQRRSAQVDQLRELGINTLVGMAEKLTFTPEFADDLKKLINQQSVQGAIFALQAMAGRQDQTELINNSRKPILMIHGEMDSLIPFERAEMAKKSAPTTELIMLKNVGHSPMLEVPENLAKMLSRLKEK